MKTKKISIREFRKLGFLQEMNRLFLHPLGFALEITIDENKNEYISGIWDYRKNDEGIYYDLKNSDNERIKRFRKNSLFVEKFKNKKIRGRVKSLGFIIEPIPENKREE